MRALAEREGADDLVLASVALCVSEAVTNVVAHAYRHDAVPGDIVLEAQAPEGGLHVSIRDDGCGMSPRPDSPGAGLGLGLIERFASWVAIRRVTPHGTQVDMSFTLH